MHFMQIINLQKRGEQMKGIIKSLVLIFIVALLAMEIHASDRIGWYCIRNKNHEQPQLDSTLDMVEKYDVYWVDKKHSSMNDEKVIYLTFDAGYENGNVEKILDILNEEDVKASFFVLENILLKNKDLIKKMIDGGHTIANHSAKHKDMTTLSKEGFSEELKALENVFEKEYALTMPKIYRPPEGKFNEENLKWAKELGYKTVMWSFAYADWDNGRQMSPDKAIKKIFDNLHNGEIMLLHPTSSTNAEIMEEMIKELKNQGFRFGTLAELCEKC